MHLTTAASFALALSILAGRWGLDRILDVGIPDVEPRSISPSLIFEVRLWSVLTFATLTFVGAPKRPGSQSTRGASISLLISLMALLFWLVISGFWTLETGIVGYKLYEISLCAIMFACTYRWAVSDANQEFSDALWNAIVISSFLLVSMSLPQIISSASSLTGARLAVLGGGPNIFGRYVCICIMACLFFKRRRVARIMLIGILLVPLVLTGSRGALLGLCVACLVCSPALLRDWLKDRWLLPSMMVGCILLCLFFAFVTPGVLEYGVHKFEDRFVEATYRQGYASSRWELFSRAFELCLERPLIGHGLAGWGNEMGQPYPHNLFLEVGVEGGCIGLVLLSGFIINLGIVIGSCIRRGSIDWRFLSLAAIMFTSAQFSGDFFDSRTFFAASLLLSVPRREASLARQDMLRKY
ncbi:O-Antigen ligase [Rosistilla ulvae]|uniref:O-Antigen ligase n=1 Tax=Rosistilla ulvae TaxID=1930277 RepID=A0A517LWQ2_9BACT|nr:O-antigen ligase family protein [Rosistilla ulvae]QDS87042.1 O-Antigen ligase [Rosistilla ulvae]